MLIKRILIVGGSGGIGSELAYSYARRCRDADTELELWARDEVKLASVALECARLGMPAATRCVDLMRVSDVVTLLQREDERQPFDVVIFASGAGDVRPNEERVDSAELVSRLAVVNYAAPAALGSLIAGRMSARGTGAIAFIGSAAAHHSLPSAPSYAGSKAGLERFVDALRISVKNYGVSVTLLSLGFVDTEAGRRTVGAKPFLVQPSRAADCIYRAIERGQSHLVYPWPFAALRWVGRLLPRPLRDFLMLQTMSKH